MPCKSEKTSEICSDLLPIKFNESVVQQRDVTVARSPIERLLVTRAKRIADRQAPQHRCDGVLAVVSDRKLDCGAGMSDQVTVEWFERNLFEKIPAGIE
jgi:hypothetical protein